MAIIAVVTMLVGFVAVKSIVYGKDTVFSIPQLAEAT